MKHISISVVEVTTDRYGTNRSGDSLTSTPPHRVEGQWIFPRRRVAKQALRASERLSIDDGIAYERDLFCLCFSSEDKEEGVEAFLQKRKPEWKGR